MPQIYSTSDFFTAEQVLKSGFFSTLDEVETYQKNALVFCQNLHFLQLAESNPCVSTILTTQSLALEVTDKAVVFSEDPRLKYFEIYKNLHSQGVLRPRMSFGIGKNCTIHPSAVISEFSKIGDNVFIGANVTISDYTSIGDNCRIESNAVIGAEGMLTLWSNEKTPLHISHAGGVSIGHNVQILSGAVIAKSLYQQFTTIGNCSQVGILANIGHGAVVGEASVISGNCVIAGKARLGNNVWVGASSSIAQGLKVGDNCQIKMGSVVVSSLRDDSVVSGNFALDHKKNIKHYLGLSNEK